MSGRPRRKECEARAERLELEASTANPRRKAALRRAIKRLRAIAKRP